MYIPQNMHTGHFEIIQPCSGWFKYVYLQGYVNGTLVVVVVVVMVEGKTGCVFFYLSTRLSISLAWSYNGLP